MFHISCQIFHVTVIKVSHFAHFAKILTFAPQAFCMNILKETINRISGFVQGIINPLTTPMRNFLAPYKAKWDKLIYPITHSWDVYCQKYPREFKIISWIYFFLNGLLFCHLIVLMTFLDSLENCPQPRN